ncbi:MAG: hypothetical protein OHK0046_51210 [Anaerolineae bacterium]
MSLKEVTYHPEHNTLVITYGEPFDAVNDATEVAMKLQERLNETSSPVHFVADFSSIKISFSDLVTGMAEAFATPGSVYANPRIKTYLVTSDALALLGQKAASEQEQYGRVQVVPYESVESALAEIAKQR